MDQIVIAHQQFWRLPNSIRARYNVKDIRRVDIVGEYVNAVVLILLANGHTDTWAWSQDFSSPGWQKRKGE
jgi:hypothetical protein